MLKPQLALTLLLTLSACGGNSPMGTSPETPKIFTTAKAERRVEPNMANIVIAVLTRATSADKAREENSVKMNALVNKLKDLKVAEDQVQTLDYQIQEVMNYHGGNSKIEGYEAINRMQIRVLDVNGVGKLIDQLIPLGANKVESVEFDVAEKEEIYKELLEEATSNAREKASRMAEAAGLGKVTILEVREEMSFAPVPMYKMAMADSARESSAPTPMAPSTTLRANVAVTARARD